MNPWTRHLMSLSLLLAVLAGARSQAFDSLSASWAALSEARRTFEGERQRHQRLVAQDRVPRQRLAIKTAVVRQLIAGELTLPEAAAWFKYVNEQTRGCRDYFRERHPSLSAEEAACRQVIEWVHAELNNTAPARAEATVRGLEAELEGHLQCEGKVELPDL
jgi:hypothetical protein